MFSPRFLEACPPSSRPLKTWGYHACLLLLLLLLLNTPDLFARTGVTLLRPHFFYPSTGYEWLEGFLQEELSQQILDSKRFALLPGNSAVYWQKELELSSESKINLSHLQQTHVDILLQASLQKVLSNIAITWKISTLKNEQFKTIKFRRIYSWTTPDQLIADIMKDWSGFFPDFSNLVAQPHAYTWQGLQEFYEWKAQKPPQIKTPEWKAYKKRLNDLAPRFSELRPSIYYQSTLLILAEAMSAAPVIDTALLQDAEIELHKAIALRRNEPQYRALMSLIFYLKAEALPAKKESIAAHSANAMSPEANLMYGITVGKTLQEGRSYILRAFEYNPSLKEKTGRSFSPYRFILSRILPALSVARNTSSKPASSSYKKMIEEGKAAFQAQQWNKAKTIFEQAATLDPEDVEAALYLSRIEIGLKNLQDAETMLGLLQQRYPKNTEVLLYLGFTLESLRKLDNAEKRYREILEIEPDSPKAMLRLGTVLIKNKNYEEAQSFLESLTSKYPKYTIAWWNLGILYQHVKQMKKALQAWQTAVQLDPESAKMNNALKQLRKRIGS